MHVLSDSQFHYTPNHNESTNSPILRWSEEGRVKFVIWRYSLWYDNVNLISVLEGIISTWREIIDKHSALFFKNLRKSTAVTQSRTPGIKFHTFLLLISVS